MPRGTKANYRGARASEGPSPWYSVSDMMRLFDVTDRCIWTWVSRGLLPQPRKQGRRWTRWVKEEVDALLKEWGTALERRTA
jgi:predicted DNA-binding transcriptional regulator AlpA